MKTKTLLTLFAVICAASISAQTSNYTAADAAKHVGETATVTDRVDGVHQSGKGNIFLNMGGKYPNQAFTAFIPSRSAAQFPNPQQYDGKTVAVTGKIQLYRGNLKSSSTHLHRSAQNNLGDFSRCRRRDAKARNQYQLVHSSMHDSILIFRIFNTLLQIVCIFWVVVMRFA